VHGHKLTGARLSIVGTLLEYGNADVRHEASTAAGSAQRTDADAEQRGIFDDLIAEHRGSGLLDSLFGLQVLDVIAEKVSQIWNRCRPLY